MEIATGIHKIDRVIGANSYLYISREGLLVIDTGMPGNSKKIVEYIRKSGHPPSDVAYVLLTHADIDHIGSASELKKLTGAKLVIQAADAPVLVGKQRFKTLHGPLKVPTSQLMRLIRFQPVEPDIVIEGESEIAGLKVIPTPGHTPGSLCYYQPNVAVFVGDVLGSDSRGNPKPRPTRFTGNASQAKSSIKLISTLEYGILLPGHGAPVIPHASHKVKQMVSKMYPTI